MTKKRLISMVTTAASVSFFGICMALLFWALMLFPMTAAGADKAEKQMVKGSLKVGKTTVTFNNAVAYRVTPEGAAKGEEWRVVHLSDKPFDRAAVKAELKKNGRYSKDFDNQLKLTFDPKGEIYYLYFYVKEGNVNLSSPPVGVTSKVSFSKDRASGRVFMEKPKKNFDDEYKFDVTFETDIISN
jgi:hypothetical protein